MNQRETLQRLLLAISTDRPIPTDLKGWLTAAINRLLAGEDRSWDSALGWNTEPATERNAQRDALLKTIAVEMLMAKEPRIIARIQRGDLPPKLKPLWENAASYSQIPKIKKQISRIIDLKPRRKAA